MARISAPEKTPPPPPPPPPFSCANAALLAFGGEEDSSLDTADRLAGGGELVCALFAPLPLPLVGERRVGSSEVERASLEGTASNRVCTSSITCSCRSTKACKQAEM